MNSIKLALHIPTSKIIHIDKASNGLWCNCKCLECGEKLIARQGKIRDKHFAHQGNSNCLGAQETAIHKLGKQILLDNSQITIPRYGEISYSETVAEKNRGTIRPDVSAAYDSQPIFFEIRVCHPVDENKKDFYINEKYRCIEIDLSNALNLSYEEIKILVLFEMSNKKFVYWTEDEPEIEIQIQPEVQAKNITKKTKQTFANWIEENIFSILITGIFIYVFYFIFNSFTRQKRFKRQFARR